PPGPPSGQPDQYGRTLGPSALPPQSPGSLQVILNGQPRELSPGETIVVGRSPDCQVLLDDNRGSRHHAQIAYEQGGWTLRDLGSRNGTFVGPTRVVRLGIAEPCAVRFGTPTSGPLVVLQPASDGSAAPPQPPQQQYEAAPNLREPSSTHAVTTRIRLGRAPDNDL